MDDTELLNRLEALENTQRMNEYNQGLQSYMNDYGEAISNDANLGAVLYSNLLAQMQDGQIEAITQDVNNQLLDSIADDCRALLKAIKRDTRQVMDAAEDAIDMVEERINEAQKTTDRADTASAELPDTFAEEEMLPPPEMPPAGPAPEEQLPVDMPPAGPAPEMPPAGPAPEEQLPPQAVVSDANMKTVIKPETREMLHRVISDIRMKRNKKDVSNKPKPITAMNMNILAGCRGGN